MMGWSVVLGWFLFFLGLIFSIILFAKYKKFYHIFYLISIFLYSFTIAYLIDSFNFDEWGISLALFISAILFLFVGYYLSRSMAREKR